MNLKRKILNIIFITMLCLSISPCIKTVYAYSDAWDELQNNVSLETYDTSAFKIEKIDGIVTITLKDDITALSNHSPISFSGTKSYKLNLNRHVLDANNNAAIDNGNVIYVGEGASLTIEGPGIITGGNNKGNGGGIYCKGKLSLTNVKINQCKTEKNGGAIYFDGRIDKTYGVDTPDQYTYRNLTINQVWIEDCYAEENGAGIWGKSVLSLTNLYIKKCKAPQGNGGGIYLAEDGAYGADQPDKCSRAEISYGYYGINIDACEAKNGSAIYVEEDSVCTLANIASIKNCIATEKGTIYSKGVLGIQTAEISSNKAKLGGGVYLEGNAFLGETAKIIENIDDSSKANNLYLTNAGRIIFGSGSDVPVPKPNMEIRISLETLPTEGNPITLFENGLSDYANYIKLDNNLPDNPNRLYIIYDGSKFVAYTDEVLPAPKTSSSPKRYTISKSEASHGDHELSNKRATKGSKVYLELYPEKGFTVEAISIYDNNGNAIEIKNEEENKYSFIMPKGNIDVDVTFMEDNSMLNFCTDVKATDECYDAVKWAYENGITTGIDNVTFGKDKEITRAQAVTFLHRAVGTPQVATSATFNDVVKGEYYEEAVAWATENNITLGVGDNLFDPNKTCSVGEIAVMIERCKATQEYKKVYDDTMNSIFGNYNEMLNEAKEKCDREQAVEILYGSFGGLKLRFDSTIEIKK